MERAAALCGFGVVGWSMAFAGVIDRGGEKDWLYSSAWLERGAGGCMSLLAAEGLVYRLWEEVAGGMAVQNRLCWYR